MPGRKPTPTHLKLIRGNPGRRPINKAEPKIADGAIEAPRFLSDDALIEWNRVAPELRRSGILTRIDATALAAYCQAYGRWRQAERALADMAARDQITKGLLIRTTNGNAVQNPIVGTANVAMRDMVRYAAELGMTPTARSRIKAEGEKQEDPADKYFAT